MPAPYHVLSVARAYMLRRSSTKEALSLTTRSRFCAPPSTARPTPVAFDVLDGGDNGCGPSRQSGGPGGAPPQQRLGGHVTNDAPSHCHHGVHAHGLACVPVAPADKPADLDAPSNEMVACHAPAWVRHAPHVHGRPAGQDVRAPC